jgi:hypothetical protein
VTESSFGFYFKEGESYVGDGKYKQIELFIGYSLLSFQQCKVVFTEDILNIFLLKVSPTKKGSVLTAFQIPCRSV